MKSLLFTPALVALLTNGSHAVQPEVPELVEFVSISQVALERPLVEAFAPADFVPIVAKPEARLDGLRQNLDELANTLQVTQQAVENVAKQRDEAREQVAQLAEGSRNLGAEVAKLRKQLETTSRNMREQVDAANRKAEMWKAQASVLEEKAKDAELARAEMKNFRGELQGAIKEFEAMKGDLAKARTELQDPIARAELRKELGLSKEERTRLGQEIEVVLMARKKDSEEAARTRTEMEGKIANLMTKVQEGKELSDELRNVNAVKMKALADVEVLRKQLETSETQRATAAEELAMAREGVTAMQAERAAALEVRTIATRERDVARAEMEGMRGKMEAALQAVDGMKKSGEELQRMQKELATVMRESAAARKGLEEKFAKAQKELAVAKEERAFLDKAKGGLQELLFKKTAEIRKLKGDLRKVQAPGDDKSSRLTDTEDKKKRATARAVVVP